MNSKISPTNVGPTPTFEMEFSKLFRIFERHVISRSKYFKEYEQDLIVDAQTRCSKHYSYLPNLVFDAQAKELFTEKRLIHMVDTSKDRKPDIDSFSKRVSRFKDKSSTPYLIKVKERRLAQLASSCSTVYHSLHLDKFSGNVLTLRQAVDKLTPSSSGGFGYWIRKAKCKWSLYRDALHFLDIKSSTWLHYPMTSGFRVQQRPDDYDDPKSTISVKTRLFMIYSGVITLFEEKFHPLSTYLAEQQTPYFTGKTGAQYSSQLKGIFAKSSKVAGSDLSGFDATVSTQLIISAFVIMAIAFKQKKLSDQNILIKLCQYFCVSVVYINHPKLGDLTFVKYSGVPSGSVFTNLIDTLVHLITISINFPELVSSKRYAICGDDLVFDPSFVSDTGKHFELLDKAYASEGMILSEESCLTQVPRYFKFLGHIWINFEKNIHIKLALHNIVWHSQFDKNLDIYERVIARTVSILANGKNGFRYFNILYPEIVTADNFKTRTVHVYNSLCRTYSDDESKKIVQAVSTRIVKLKRILRFGYLIT